MPAAAPSLFILGFLSGQINPASRPGFVSGAPTRYFL
jgi:hypothetical protein